jgi:hypothetical protein
VFAPGLRDRAVAHTVPVYTSRLPDAVRADWPVTVEDWTTDEGGPVWVAADESGTTGEDLLGDQPVIAHATVRIDDQSASEVLARNRRKPRRLSSSTSVADVRRRRSRIPWRRAVLSLAAST